MKTRLLPAALLALYILCPLAANAQQWGWEVETKGFFDNLEYQSPYRDSKTMGGMWLTPKLRLAWDGEHELHGGCGLYTNWGRSDKKIEVDHPILYYMYNSPDLKFTLGSFSRDVLRGSWPTALMSDSVRYYDPCIQGMSVVYEKGRSYVEGFIDWVGCRDTGVREQFLIGSSALLVNAASQYVGCEGYYHHYALPTDAAADEHIHDYSVTHFFAGADLARHTGLDSLDVRVGLLTDLERERGAEMKWHLHPGVLVQATAVWKRLTVKEMAYFGKGQQMMGGAGVGKWYWADPFFRSKRYSRTDLDYQFIRSRYANATVGTAVHFDDHGRFSWQQRVCLSIRLGKDF